MGPIDFQGIIDILFNFSIFGSVNENLSTTCLNCSTPLVGSYCHHCGQQNLPLKLSVWQLLVLFFGEFFNYDGRLFRSIRLLVSSPAGLTKAYMEGKRSSYVNPVRFYLFTSAFYFLFINYLVVPKENSLQSELSEELSLESNSNQFAKGFSEGFIKINSKTDSIKPKGTFDSEFASFEAYKANQAALNSEDRASDFELRIVEKFYEVKEKYKDGTSFFGAMTKEILTRLPQLLLLTLPLLALVSKLIFFRRRDYWYFDHLVFVLHLATSLFFLLFIQEGLEFVASSTGLSWLGKIADWLGILWLGYYLFSFKRFFGKSWKKTLLLFLWSGFWQSILLTMVFALLVFISFFNL